jgi:tetratricopeptide (TPR) repeat protein
MGLLQRHKTYDRAQLLAAASKAHAKGRNKKALALYQQVLRAEPNNSDLHRKVAPLLARAKEREKAWRSFRIAAQAMEKEGFQDKAIGIYREAVHYLPHQVEAWMAIGELHFERRRKTDAVESLLEGRKHLRRRKDRPNAMRLLSRARQIDPGHVEVGLDLAKLWRQTGDRRGAGRLLEELVRVAHRSQRRRIRWAQFSVNTNPATFMRWLGTVFGSS